MKALTALTARLASATALSLVASVALAAPAEESLTLKFQAGGGDAAGTVQIQFIGYRDQRCPTNVQCISAGTAQAIFWVQPGEDAGQMVTLPWAGDAVKAAGYSLQLKSLEPRPNTRKPPNPADYEAVVALTKLSGKP